MRKYLKESQENTTDDEVNDPSQGTHDQCPRRALIIQGLPYGNNHGYEHPGRHDQEHETYPRRAWEENSDHA